MERNTDGMALFKKVQVGENGQEGSGRGSFCGGKSISGLSEEKRRYLACYNFFHRWFARPVFHGIKWRLIFWETSLRVSSVGIFLFLTGAVAVSTWIWIHAEDRELSNVVAMCRCRLPKSIRRDRQLISSRRFLLTTVVSLCLSPPPKHCKYFFLYSRLCRTTMQEEEEAVARFVTRFPMVSAASAGTQEDASYRR